MRSDWPQELVALSYLIAVLGSFTALKLCRQHAGARGAEKWRSLLAGALAMGAGAIWSMHFIGMLAFDWACRSPTTCRSPWPRCWWP